MRTLEVVLILVNLLALFLSFKKRSKAVRLGTVGVNLFVFVIHGFLEGFRYQMIFSYIFVVMFAVYTLLKIWDKFYNARMPKVLKIISLGLSFVFLAVTSLMAYALPVFSLPKPTGSYDVGIKYLHLVDEKRNDPFLEKSTKKRELMVKLYYPSKKDKTKPNSPYFRNSKELIKLFTAGYGMPDFVFSHLNLVKTNSKEDLNMSDKEKNYPVILFSHGAGTSMEIQTSSGEDLASHGYVVAAIDHTYVSGATAFPSRTVSAREATTDFSMPEPAEIITQIMADDSKFVIESLREMNDGKIDSILKGKLNLDKIGAIGHSVGGAAAYNLAINDSRVKAVINLDGRVFITPKGEYANMAPFLMLASDKYAYAIEKRDSLLKKFEDMSVEEQKNMLAMYGTKEAYNEAYKKESQNAKGLYEVLKASGNLYKIEGSEHMKFTDIGLFIGVSRLRELIGIGGKTEPVKCLKITEAVTLAFFDRHLKGETNGSVGTLVNKHQELKKVDLK